MTRLELEARRMEAIPDLDADVKQAKIARRFGVSRTTVSRWKRARAEGNSLKRTLTPGRPPRLTPTDVKALKFLYAEGPGKLLYAEGPGIVGTTKWTQNSFAKLISFVAQIDFHPDHVGKLMRRWGLRPKREKSTE